MRTNVVHAIMIPVIAERMRIRESVAIIGRVSEAQGAFAVPLKIDTDLASIAVAERLIREFQVAVTPGEAFGPIRTVTAGSLMTPGT